MSVTELFKEITTALDARNIPYMVSGSMAMLAYTVARTTRDIDIVNFQKNHLVHFTKYSKISSIYTSPQWKRSFIEKECLMPLIIAPD